MDKQHIPLATLREAYSVYNRTTGKSPATVRWYEDKLNLFERFVGDDAILADVNVGTVRDYIGDLQKRDVIHANNPCGARREGTLSSSYIQGFVWALRAFASWLHQDGYTETNVLKVLRPPKVQQKVTEVLTDEEATKLVSVFDQDEPFGARNYAIVLTFLDCGLRVSELCLLVLIPSSSHSTAIMMEPVLTLNASSFEKKSLALPPRRLHFGILCWQRDSTNVSSQESTIP